MDITHWITLGIGFVGGIVTVYAYLFSNASVRHD